MKVVAGSARLGHANGTEVAWGVPEGHWEAPVRAEVIDAGLRRHPDRFAFVPPTDHGRAPLDAVHDPGLVDFLARAWRDFQSIKKQREVFPDTFVHPSICEGMGPAPLLAAVQAQLGYWCFETMTPLVEGTYDAARAAVDIALTAADLVLGGERSVYGLCRPPGHHAPRAAYGGYCYFNNAAIGAQMIASMTRTRVRVLDVDCHHGNGTRQIFYDRDDVQYVSLHGDPRSAYPYFIGHADEVGTGRGRGSNVNLPLPRKTSDEDYTATLVRALENVDAFDPSVIVVSLGVDTHELGSPRRLPGRHRVLRDARPARCGVPTSARHPSGGRLPRAVPRRQCPQLAHRRGQLAVGQLALSGQLTLISPADSGPCD